MQQNNDIATKKALAYLITGIFIVFPSAYFSIFYKMSNTGSIHDSLKKNSISQIKKYCNLRSKKTYLSCYRKDFFSLLHRADFLQSYYLLKNEIKIYKMNEKNINEHIDMLEVYFSIVLSKKLRQLNFFSGNYFVQIYLKFYHLKLIKKLLEKHDDLKYKIRLNRIRNNILAQPWL